MTLGALQGDAPAPSSMSPPSIEPVSLYWLGGGTSISAIVRLWLSRCRAPPAGGNSPLNDLLDSRRFCVSTTPHPTPPPDGLGSSSMTLPPDLSLLELPPSSMARAATPSLLPPAQQLVK